MFHHLHQVRKLLHGSKAALPRLQSVAERKINKVGCVAGTIKKEKKNGKSKTLSK